MKIFSRKKSAKENVSPSAETPDSEQSFYTQHVEKEVLNEFSDGYGRQTRRTSLHSPARRRETSNRAGNKEIFFLFFRAGLIIFLLAAGFLVLKFGLGKLAEPSEKEQEQWVANAALMGNEPTSGRLSVEPAPSQAQAVTMELIAKRLRQWAEAERHMRAAEMRERDGLDEEAAVRLGQALRFAPDHRPAQQLLMEIYMRSENYTEAVPLCIRLLDQDSQQWGVKVNLLQALQRLGQTEACLVLADQMLEKEPNNLELLEVAAFARRVAGNGEEALALFGRILQNDGHHSVALAGSGAICRERGNWQKAIPYYLELVRTHPEMEHYHNLVRCYAQMEEAGKAVIFMGQAASLYGESEVASWLRHDLEAFGSILETVEYRSFADRIVGVETRKAIEDIRRREIEKKAPEVPGGLDLPVQLELKISR